MKMNYQKTYVQNTGKTEYTVNLTVSSDCIKITMEEKLAVDSWSGSFDAKFIE